MSETAGLNPKSVVKGMELRLDTAINGCSTAFPPAVTTLPIRNVQYAQGDVGNKLVALKAPWTNKRAAKATISQFAAGKKAWTKQVNQFLADLEAALAGAVGADNEVLTQWGFKVKKPAKPRTAEQLTLQAAKAKLTRQKRGTMGSRQKAAIKTTVTPTVHLTPGAPPLIIANEPSPPPPPPPPAAGQ